MEIDPFKKNGVRFINNATRNIHPTDDECKDVGNDDDDEKVLDAEDNSKATEKRAKCERKEFKRIPNTRRDDKTTYKFSCFQCDKIYARKEDLHYHIHTKHNETEHVKRHYCVVCNRGFLRKKDLIVHEKHKKCYSTRGRWTPVYKD